MMKIVSRGLADQQTDYQDTIWRGDFGVARNKKKSSSLIFLCICGQSRGSELLAFHRLSKSYPNPNRFSSNHLETAQVFYLHGCGTEGCLLPSQASFIRDFAITTLDDLPPRS
jgi:hypothetical protein